MAGTAETITHWNRIDRLGRRWIDAALYGFDVFKMAYVAVRTPIFHERNGARSILSVILAQIYFTGWQALPLIGTLALAAGAAVILNASAIAFLDNVKVVANLLVVAVIRELGPLLISLVLIARSGTAIATEIGNMRVNREIDALETMGINPLSYIVFPRLVGGVLSIVCLTFYFDVIALAGGYLAALAFRDIPLASYLDAVSDALTPGDVALFFGKSLLNGASIFSIACYQGLKVAQSSHEVPQATTRAVISSITVVGIVTVVATLLFYARELVGLAAL